eukprot:5513726-Alexandrium_andersonii.AAC.1
MASPSWLLGSLRWSPRLRSAQHVQRVLAVGLNCKCKRPNCACARPQPQNANFHAPALGGGEG